METSKSPCLECKHQDGCHHTERFSNCPERRDYIEKTEGREPHFRGFNPTTPGFEPADPDYIAPAGPKLINPGYESRKNSVIPEKKSESKPVKPITEKSVKKCEDCPRTANTPLEIKALFSKSWKSKDGYTKICKVCHGKKIREGQKRKAEMNKKKPTESAANQAVADIRENKNIEKTCTDCGVTFVGNEIEENFAVHNKSRDGFFNYCRECHAKRFEKIVLKPKRERKKNSILLDFTDYLDVLNDLNEMALASFRTTEQQVMFLISEAVVQRKKA